MAINYTKIGWDTSKYVNPTNMNQMDNGIKAACDGVDEISANYIKSESTAQQVISATGTGEPLAIKATLGTVARLKFIDNSNALLGYFSVNSSKKPLFYDTADHEIALAENVIAKSYNYAQVITNTRTAQYVVMFLKSTQAGRKSYIGFQDVNDTILGYLGINENNKPVYQNGASGSTEKEIALIGTLTVTNGTIDANGDMALSLSSGQYPIMWVRATGVNGDRVVFFDGSSTSGLQPYAHFETLRNTTLSGTVIYVEM